MQKARPCPFCGGKDLLFEAGFIGRPGSEPGSDFPASITCMICDLQITGNVDQDMPLEHILMTWNQRPPASLRICSGHP